MSDAASIRPAGITRFGFAILLVALIQSAVLCWMIYDRVSLIESGREIVLDTVPVDPRSLFRGDYVILTYGISRLDTGKLGGEDGFERGDTVYVTLLKDESGLWRAKAIGQTFPETVDGGEIVMRGRVTYSGASDTNVKYGIESYFVPEGEGKTLENMVRERKLQVLVAVAEDGEAAIKGLMVDGKLQYEEPLF